MRDTGDIGNVERNQRAILHLSAGVFWEESGRAKRAPDARRLIPPLFDFFGQFCGKNGGWDGKASVRRLKWPTAAEARASFFAHSGHPNRVIFGNFRISRTLGRIPGRRAKPIFATKSNDSANLDPPRCGIRFSQAATRFVMRRGAHASFTRRIYGRPDDRAMGGVGVRRAVTAFTIIEEIAAPPPENPAPRAALRSKHCLGNEAAALPRILADLLTQFELTQATPNVANRTACGHFEKRSEFAHRNGTAKRADNSAGLPTDHTEGGALVR